ncbi:lipocalin-like domain-containing protein [Photobacterium damselae subsp. damselae]|uniref:Lipocalin-like domain-containing protein n=1 Tax=Photobacterium damselae subsp. damselae TaxID=85581 RepID=A0A850QZR0_PHODD|nr:lipocalin-like domain-containing protein [Photobacterium damselae subsp. damselae]
MQVSWDPSWLGLTLQRKISFQDNMLVIDTLPQVGIDGKMSTATLVWKKIKSKNKSTED